MSPPTVGVTSSTAADSPSAAAKISIANDGQDASTASASLAFIDTPQRRFTAKTRLTYQQRFSAGSRSDRGQNRPMKRRSARAQPTTSACTSSSSSPVINRFLLLQRYFVRGISLTGIKG